MEFLRTFWDCLAGFLPSKKLLPDHPLSRFIFSPRFFSIEKREVKGAAFMPRAEPPLNRFELSVYRIKRLSEARIWAVGGKVGARSQRRICARADFDFGAVIRAGLTADPDPWPRRHVNLIGWPASGKKSEHMLIASKLALAATLKVPPEHRSPTP